MSIGGDWQERGDDKVLIDPVAMSRAVQESRWASAGTQTNDSRLMMSFNALTHEILGESRSEIGVSFEYLCRD
jgi:hypothetical protein